MIWSFWSSIFNFTELLFLIVLEHVVHLQISRAELDEKRNCFVWINTPLRHVANSLPDRLWLNYNPFHKSFLIIWPHRSADSTEGARSFLSGELVCDSLHLRYVSDISDRKVSQNMMKCSNWALHQSLHKFILIFILTDRTPVLPRACMYMKLWVG